MADLQCFQHKYTDKVCIKKNTVIQEISMLTYEHKSHFSISAESTLS